MSPTEENILPPDVAAAVSRGRIIEAIKLLRVSKGVGLKEAKEAIDAYVQSRPELRTAFPISTESRAPASFWLSLLALIAAALYWRFFYK